MKSLNWIHAPLHEFIPERIHVVTAVTRDAAPLFRGQHRLRLLRDLLLLSLNEQGWEPRAWACLNNHYHVLALAPENAQVERLIRGLHRKLDKAVTRLDGPQTESSMDKQWSACIPSADRYHALLHEVMQDPVRHGQVSYAESYPYSSAGWFLKTQASEFQEQVSTHAVERLEDPGLNFRPVPQPLKRVVPLHDPGSAAETHQSSPLAYQSS